LPVRQGIAKNGGAFPLPYPMNSPASRFLAVVILAGGLSACSTTSAPTSLSSPTPDQAFALLKEGNSRAVNDQLKGTKTSRELRTKLAKGQQPFATVLACADSRVGPEIIFDQPMGNLFVCRVAGNVTDPDVTGSIEYAVDHLHCPLIAVVGHSECGAVKAALSGKGAPGNLGVLLHRVHMGTGLPADEKAKLDAAIGRNVAWQVKSLTDSSPVIAKYVREGKVRIVGGVYSLSTGEVLWQ
jgi:carbonic anhydrase